MHETAPEGCNHHNNQNVEKLKQPNFRIIEKAIPKFSRKLGKFHILTNR